MEWNRRRGDNGGGVRENSRHWGALALLQLKLNDVAEETASVSVSRVVRGSNIGAVPQEDDGCLAMAAAVVGVPFSQTIQVNNRMDSSLVAYWVELQAEWVAGAS